MKIDNNLMIFGKILGLPAEFCRRTIVMVDDVISRWLEYAEKSGISEERAMEVLLYLKFNQM